jgi:hypothetical protein
MQRLPILFIQQAVRFRPMVMLIQPGISSFPLERFKRKSITRKLFEVPMTVAIKYHLSKNYFSKFVCSHDFAKAEKNELRQDAETSNSQQPCIDLY